MLRDIMSSGTGPQISTIADFEGNPFKIAAKTTVHVQHTCVYKHCCGHKLRPRYSREEAGPATYRLVKGAKRPALRSSRKKAKTLSRPACCQLFGFATCTGVDLHPWNDVYVI